MRRNVQYQYVMPYGRLPMIGGNIYLAGAKTVAKKAIPKLAKLWKSLSPEMKAAVISGGVELGSKAAIRAGDAIGNLSQKAEDKLAGLLGRKTAKTARKKVSKKARKMIKDLVKEKKRNVKLPSSFKNQLSASEQRQLSKGG